MGQIIREILREYDKEKNLALRKKDKRTEAMYIDFPRLKEIDDELASIGLSIAKSILQKTNIGKTSHSDLQESTALLREEREKIYKENDIVNRYFKDIYKCNVCEDTGFIKNMRCSCFNQRTIEKFYEMSNLSKVLEDENFDNFNLGYYSNEKDPNRGISPKQNMSGIFNECLEYVNNFGNDNHRGENILFMGDPGLGKTFLCNCIAKDLLDKGMSVLYVTAPKLFKIVENQRFGKDEQEKDDEYINFVTEADLLIIDDLGTEFSTIVTTSELFHFVNTRLLNKKSTIISTNLQYQNIIEQYSERITSRIFGNYSVMQFFGDDIRMLRKYS